MILLRNTNSMVLLLQFYTRIDVGKCSWFSGGQGPPALITKFLTSKATIHDEADVGASSSSTRGLSKAL